MATPAQVLELVASLRSGGPVARGKTVAEAFKAVRSMSVKDKRDLALLVAERTAPQLVPRIQAEGLTELNAEQVKAVVDMVRNLDDEDVEDLKRTFTDPSARDDALRAVGAGLAAATAVATDEPDEEEVEPDTSLPSPEAIAERTAEEQAELDRQLAEARATRERAEREAQVAIERARAEAEREKGAAPPAPIPAQPAEPVEYQAIFDELPAVAGLDGPGAIATAASDRAKSPSWSSPATTTATEAGWRSEVEQAPDGWRRRRAVQRLIDDGQLGRQDVRPAIERLASAMDRTWLAASAIEADLLDLDELDGLVDDRAAARLRRRYG